MSAKVTPEIHQWTHDGDRVLLVKLLNRDGTTYGGFKWPQSGPVRPDNFSRKADCDSGGLFGWPWGVFIGDGKDPDACADWIGVLVKEHCSDCEIANCESCGGTGRILHRTPDGEIIGASDCGICDGTGVGQLNFCNPDQVAPELHGRNAGEGMAPKPAIQRHGGRAASLT